jgi:Family of unknown function (DUF5906)
MADILREAEAEALSALLTQLDEIEDWSDYADVVVGVAKREPNNLRLRDQIAAHAAEGFDNGRELVFGFFARAAREAEALLRETTARAEAITEQLNEAVAQPVKKISPPPQPEIESVDGASDDRAREDEPTAADAIAHGLSPDAPKWFVRKIMQERGIKARSKIEQTKSERKQVEEAAAAPTGSALVIVPQPQPEATLIPANETPEETALRQMNNKHAVISNLGGKCVIMEWVPSAISEGQKELSYQSFQAFRERYANHYIDVPNGRGHWSVEPFAPIWLAHPHRRQYEGLDLVPNGPPVLPNGYLNLWKDWGVAPRKGSWRLMQRHIAEVLANGNQSFEDYIKRATAWKFQNPGLRPEVVLALLGGKGVGKGAWGYAQMLIYGPHGLQIYSTEHLTGKHNQHLQNKLFLYLDEALWGGDRQAERVLKGLVTEKSMLIEPKNINAFPWPNRLGIYMSGNDKWIVPASHDERRYAVNKVSERWKQNKGYFAPLFEEINNGGAAAMLYDMLQMDLEGWHPRENVPQTKALLDQKMLGLGGLELWYVHLLNVGELPRPDKKNPRFVISKNLLEAAKNHNARNKYTTAEELAGFLKEMGCAHKSNGKNWGWIFPPLPAAREAWQCRAGGDWEWLTPDIGDWAEKPALEQAAERTD